jgi:hypothetical protein
MAWGNPYQGMDRTQLVDGLSRTIYRTGVDLPSLRPHSRRSGHLVVRADVGGTLIGIPPLAEESFLQQDGDLVGKPDSWNISSMGRQETGHSEAKRRTETQPQRGSEIKHRSLQQGVGTERINHPILPLRWPSVWQ